MKVKDLHQEVQITLSYAEAEKLYIVLDNMMSAQEEPGHPIVQFCNMLFQKIDKYINS